MSGRVVYPDLYIPPGGRGPAEPPPASGTCRACGCTDERACPGGCAWVDDEHTLCSACAMRALARQGGQHVGQLVGDGAAAWLRRTFGPTLGGIMADVASSLVRGGQGTKPQRPARRRVKAAIPSRKRPGGSRR